MNVRARLLLVSLLLIVPAAAAQDLRPYNVRWNTPSKDSLDSMPLAGRLGAGGNVWIQDGSIWLYLGHNGAYDERGRLLKLGCIRITPDDGALDHPASFQQELDLATGAIHLQTTSSQGGAGFNASLWFAGDTLIVETTAAKP